MNRSIRLRAREIFFAVHGVGPYACWGCETKVSFDEVHVHHIDRDRSNGKIENLTGMHASCHTRYHNQAGHRRKGGWPKGQKHPAVAASNRRRAGEKRPPLSPEHRAKLSAAKRKT